MRATGRIFAGLVAAIATVGALAGEAAAQLNRSPTTMVVGTSTTTLQARIAAAVPFTIGATATICLIPGYALATGCAAGQILGTVRISNSTAVQTPTTLATLTATVPRSTATRLHQLVRQNSANALAFLVVPVTPVGAGDIDGGGPLPAGATAFLNFNIHPGGGGVAAPLGLTRVKIQGVEPGDPEVRILRLTRQNLDLGEVLVTIEYSGQGLLTGYWGVRTPHDPPLRELDRQSEGSLADDQRGSQRSFQRLKRVRIRLGPSGLVTLRLPYSELTRDIPGVYDVLFEIDDLRDRRGRSVLPGSQPAVVEFGGAAAFPLPAMRYWVGVVSMGQAQNVDLEARLVIPPAADTGPAMVAWTPLPASRDVMRLVVRDLVSGAEIVINAPAAAGFAVLPDMTLDEGVEILAELLTPAGTRHPGTNPEYVPLPVE